MFVNVCVLNQCISASFQMYNRMVHVQLLYFNRIIYRSQNGSVYLLKNGIFSVLSFFYQKIKCLRYRNCDKILVFT